jgi:predicted transcriptional regulator YheO
MKSIDEQRPLLRQVMDLLEQHMGYNCEIVLHDLTGDYDRTIVDIRNGHITGRRVGDCGSNLGLEVLRGTVVDGERYNYITYTPDAKVLRSSSMYMRDDSGRVVGALCVNTDITQSVKYEQYLHEMNNMSADRSGRTPEVFAQDVKQLLEHLLEEGERLVGKRAPEMTKDDRVSFIRHLDRSGAFLITKSSERVCEFLGISKYTLYATLDKLRNGEKADRENQ